MKAIARLAAASPVLVPPGIVQRAALAHYIEPFLTYCERVRELSPNTVAAYRNVLEPFVAFAEALRVPSPEMVKTRHVEAYKATLRAQGAARQTVNQHRAALVTFWRYLITEDVTAFNPAAHSHTLRQPRPIPDFLTITEQEKVLTTLGGLTSVRGRQGFVLVATGLLTGLRVGELVALETHDLRLADGLLKVTHGKGRKQRLVPVIPWLRRVLDDFIARVRPRIASAERVPYLFVSPRAAGRGQPMETRVAYAIIRALVSPIVGRPIHPHALRHSYATRLLTLGADLESIRSVMGHSSLSTTGIYLHVPTQTLHAKIARWLVGEAAEETPAERSALLIDPQPELDAVAARAMHEPLERAARHMSHPFADYRVKERLRAQRLRGRWAASVPRH